MAYAPFDLHGKVALVTGGNSGIGLGMAEALAQAGADVVIWGSNVEKNIAAEGKLTNYGVRVLAQQVNVGDEAAVVAGMAEAVTAMGRVDFVAANAGMGRGSPSFDEMSTEVWRQVMTVNLDGVFWSFREAC
jgi:NAD(P)-dependent dehydrogenase (short-subunit alcohol dehydrogenase family)